MISVSGEIRLYNSKKEKIAFLRDQCKEENPSFLAFAETNLNESIKDAEFEIEGYSHATSHRMKRVGGGVIIYVRNDLTYKILASESDEMCSIVAVYINELNLTVFMAYRPPPNSKNQYHGEILEESFKNIIIKNIKRVMSEFNTPMPDIILTGDFNFPKASWKAGIGAILPDLKSNKKSLQQLIEVATELNLLQKVTEGTRETRNGGQNILELIFTNNHELISNIYIHPSALTDHKYIICETSHISYPYNSQPFQSNETNLSTFNYETADWKTIKSKLSMIRWSEILEMHKTSEEKLRKIMEIVLNVIEKNCEKFKNPRGKHTNKIPRERRILMRKKKTLKSKLKGTNLSIKRKFHLEQNIKDIENKLLSSHKQEKIDDEARAIKNIKINPKHFFAYSKKKLKTKNVIGPFRINDQIINTLKEISEKISDQYSSSFSIPDKNFKISNPEEFFDTNLKNGTPMLSDFQFNENSIIDAIKDISNNSAPGPDHFPVKLLKECAEELSVPLYILWRYSLDNGDVASLLKTAIICPILKPGSQRDHPKAYRPVLLTSHVIKVFERIIRKSLDYLQENNLLPDNQHGFLITNMAS